MMDAPSSPPTRLGFDLTVTMESDWHIGIGAGRNRAVDRLTDRDEDGLPVIRASTLRGIWRDATEQLAFALDESKYGAWHGFVRALLGSQPQIEGGQPDKDFAPPLASRLQLSDARLTPALRARLALNHPGCAALRDALTFVKVGVKIDPRTGMALDDHLRFEEVVRAGTVLHARGEVVVPDTHKQVAAAFLVAAARLVQRLGGKRRRGLGQCRIELRFDDESLPRDQVDAAKLLEKSTSPDFKSSPPPKADGATDSPAANSLDNTPWQKLSLRLKLREPVIVADAVLGNVTTSLDFIPGSLLLPHVVRALTRAGFSETEINRMIAAHNLRVLPAYPELNGCRAVPVPFSWRQPKLGGGLSSSFKELSSDAPQPPEPAQQRPLRTGYIDPVATCFEKTHKPGKTIRTHNTVEDRQQTPTSDVGGVYVYEALAPKQVLRSEVWLRGEDVETYLQAFREELTGHTRLGRARNAGYGRVEVVEDAASSHREARSKDSQTDTDEAIYLFLESDALIRSNGLEPTTALEALLAEIENQLGHAKGALFVPEKTRAEIRTRRLEGWLARWGLPRPSFIALQAGSVVKLCLSEKATALDFTALEENGIGERRAEGYGRVCVNPKFLTQLPNHSKDVPERHMAVPPSSPFEIQDMEEPDFLHHIERIAWEQTIARRAEYFATASGEMADKLKWKPRNNKPPMSQLGALRAAMGGYETETEAKAARAWLQKLKSHPKGKDKWPKGSLAALEKLLSKEKGTATAWKWLHLPTEETDAATDNIWGGVAVPAVLLSTPEEMREKLGYFAVRSLLHAAMHAHKRAMEQPHERSRKREATSA